MIVVMGSHTSSYQVLCKRHPLPGEYLIGKELRQILDGGKGSNQAIAAARFGSQVEFLSLVGQDEEGNKLLDFCEKYGVSCSHVEKGEKQTGMGIAFVDEQGNPMGVTIPGCLKEISQELVLKNKGLIKKADIFLTQLEIPVSVALLGCRVAHEYGALTILNPAPADELILTDNMDYIDILTPNENEAKCLAGILQKENSTAEEAAKIIYEKTGIKRILVTLGEKGVLVCQEGDITYRGAFTVKVVDTSGAGDCFNAVLACMLEHYENYEDAIRYAQAASAISIQQKDVWPSYPSREEVEKFMNKR